MSHLDAVPLSGIIRIRDMMYAVRDPFRLDQGDVSFDVPDSLKAAMHRAIDENRTHYLQTAGLPRLLELLADKLRTANGTPIGSPDEVLVTNGGIHGMYAARNSGVALRSGPAGIVDYGSHQGALHQLAAQPDRRRAHPRRPGAHR